MKPGFRKNADRSLDSKGRLMLPPEYRDIISAASSSGGFTLVFYNGCLVACPTPEWEAQWEDLAPLRNLSPAEHALRSQLLGRAEDLELDSQGRVRISQALMRYAGLGKDVILVGMGSRFEIWDRRRFEDIDNKLDDAARAQAVNGLTQRGIKLSL